MAAKGSTLYRVDQNDLELPSFSFGVLCIACGFLLGSQGQCLGLIVPFCDGDFLRLAGLLLGLLLSFSLLLEKQGCLLSRLPGQLSLLERFTFHETGLPCIGDGLLGGLTFNNRRIVSCGTSFEPFQHSFLSARRSG